MEDCRLLARNADNERPWRRKLCDTCPIPELIITSQCRHLEVEAEVRRKFLRDQVTVTFAMCTKHLIELDNPGYCPQCAAER